MKSIACSAMLAALIVFSAAQAADKPRTYLKAQPENPVDPEKAFKSLDAKVQTLKQNMLLLNRDIVLLEEDLYYPAPTRLTVFMAMSVDPRFTLESVQLKVGNRVLGRYSYDEKQNEALKVGGAHRLKQVNLSPGQHSISADLRGYFTDKKGQRTEYSGTTQMTLDKQFKPAWVVLQMDGQPGDFKPRFAAREWKPEL